MKRNWLLYLVIFSLALNFGTIGTLIYLRYQDKTPRLAREMPPPMPMRDLWKNLNLDDSQRQAVHHLFPEHRAKIDGIRQDLFQKRQELFELLKAEAPDMAAIRAKISEVSALQGNLEEEMVRHLFEFKKLLKPEQNTAFLNLVRTRLDQSMGGPFGPMGGRGPRHGLGMGPGPGMPPGPPPPPPPGKGPDPMGPGPRGQGCTE